MAEHLVVQTPEGAPGQLILLFHGVGSTPQAMVPLARQLADQFPAAAIVAVAAPDPHDAAGAGAGRQWFSVRGITEENRAGRIAAAMPRFVETVGALQRDTGTTPAQTALIGFSQGAIMALESTQTPAPPLAGRVVSLAGRFAHLPQRVPPETTLHFIHGKDDPVIDYRHTVDAAEQLVRLGGDLTADVLPGLGHTVAPEMTELLLRRLTTHVPRRLWEQAMRDATAGGL